MLRTTAALATLSLFANSLHADDAPLFVADETDPTHLVRGPGLIENGFDANYFATMARPSLDRAKLDAIAEALRASGRSPNRTIASPVDVPSFTHATILNGNILIVEGSDGASQTTGGETAFLHGSGGLETVVSKAWQTLGDEFDFITVWTTFDDEGYAAYYLPLQNDVEGLGNCNFNTGESFGCTFQSFNQDTRLQGFVFMNSIEYWRGFDWNFDGVVHPYTSPDSSIYSTLAQEVAHRWLAALRFKDPVTGATSKKLLGRDGSHWAAFVDTDGSVLDGWDWIEDDVGLKAIGAMDTFWAVDLYAMGALAAPEVPRFFTIDDARFVPNGYFGNQLIPAAAAISVPSPSLFEANNVQVRATGSKKELGIADIVAAEGMRCPTPGDAPSAFRQLFVLVTRPNQTASQVASHVSQLEDIRIVWEEFFREHTRSRMKICTDVVGDCSVADARLGRLALRGADRLEPGVSVELDVRALAFDAPVEAGDIVLSIEGDAAAHATLPVGDAYIGTVGANLEFDQRFALDVDEACPCGSELQIDATYLSANAPVVTQTYRLFVGLDDVVDWSFDGADGFTVSGDGLSAFSKEALEAHCEMSPFAPIDDASPGAGVAYMTGRAAGDIGETALESPSFAVERGMKLAFSAWAKGVAELRVTALGGAEPISLALVDETTGDGWQHGLVSLDALVDAGVTDARVRFEAAGGDGEVALDEVRLLAPAGACVEDGPVVDDPPIDETPIGAVGCGECAAGGGRVDGALAVFALALLLARRGARLRRRNA